MPDWLADSLTDGVDVGFAVVIGRLTLSLVLGMVVAGIYRLSQRRPKSDLVPFMTTMLLLTVLIAMVTLVIGNSVARAFSLVGALSIVRFRTVVEDTRDTAFVIFSVVVGMAVGAGIPIVSLVGIPVVAAGAFVANRWRPADALLQRDGSLSIRLGIGGDAEHLFDEVFARHLDVYRLVSVSTARQGSALDLIYDVRLRDANGTLPLVRELNSLEGVQEVAFSPPDRTGRS